MFPLSNLSGAAAGNILPLHWNPAILFRRARVLAGGTVLEDIDDFNRLSLMFTALKSQDDQKEIAMEGFGLFDRVHDMYEGGKFADPTLAEEDNDERKFNVSVIGTKRVLLQIQGQFCLSQCWAFWLKKN